MHSASPSKHVGVHPGRTLEGVFDELRAVQHEHGFISAESMRRIAERRGIAVKDLHSVVSFYPFLYLEPQPRASVSVCTDMACHLRHSDATYRELKSTFARANAGEVSVKECSCVGRCDRPSAIVINEKIYDGMSSTHAEELVNAALAERPLPPEPAVRVEHVQAATDPYKDKAQRYGVLRNLIASRDYAAVFTSMNHGGLRGMGGAGFPTHLKWERVRDGHDTEKFLVCNADESEPGTIKDRFLLTNLPHIVLEGILIGAIVTGCERGYIYIRHEYEEAAQVLEAEIRACYQNQLLGRKILGSAHRFDLEVFRSPGGYICGEETALIEAIEGKRAEPRNRPPGLGHVGLWGKPTLLNNVETFAHVPALLHHGPAWYKAQAREGSAGMKWVGVSGHVERPGVYEVPMGLTYAELIYNYAGGMLGGRKLIGFAPSGPSSGFLPASLADTPMEWGVLNKLGSMVGSSAVVVCGEDACMLDMAVNATRFYRNESCGKCVPCRTGSQKLLEMIANWTRGKRLDTDEVALKELSHALRQTSICGLGQVVSVPIDSVLKHFPDLVQMHIEKKQCPANVCFVPRERENTWISNLVRIGQ